MTPAGTISEAKLRRKAIAAMDANTMPVQQEASIEVHNESEFNGLALELTTQAAILQWRQEHQHKAEIVLYSDGSVVEAGMKKISMAFGVVIDMGNNNFEPLVDGGVAGFASSTKVELVGLLMAVLSSPRNTTVKIFIDNMAVVQIFQKLVQDQHIATACAKLGQCMQTGGTWWQSWSRTKEEQ